MRTVEPGAGSWASTLRYRPDIKRWYLANGVFQRYRPTVDVGYKKRFDADSNFCWANMASRNAFSPGDSTCGLTTSGMMTPGLTLCILTILDLTKMFVIHFDLSFPKRSIS